MYRFGPVVLCDPSHAMLAHIGYQDLILGSLDGKNDWVSNLGEDSANTGR